MLDNIPHIKAYWIMMTPRIAQIALRFGADDLDGTVVEEKIYHDAGATTSQSLRRGELLRLIREAGREPVERDTLYRPVQRTETRSPFWCSSTPRDPSVRIESKGTKVRRSRRWPCAGFNRSGAAFRSERCCFCSQDAVGPSTTHRRSTICFPRISRSRIGRPQRTG